ncbi:MAG: CoB--CoM heterodisulfide reductase iron-sulfur subunit A family protein [Candidatus Aminicenantes bacterium]|nr:MAG: CoB--CoM heterodisulfide reductase iron-sulfur subunit A family protein [Candidatus Aminicenantes bacterium]
MLQASEKPRIGVYVCHCGINIASNVDVFEVVEFARGLPHVVIARDYKFMCSDPGQEIVQKDIADLNINRVIVASCSPLMHEVTFRRCIASAGLNPFFFQMANIREQVSWVTADHRQATEKAMALTAAAVRRAVWHAPLEQQKVPVNPNVLVVGGGISGIQAALTLADSGKHVYLVEKEPSIGGHMAQFDKTFPTLDCAACILTPKMSAVRAHPNITLWTYSQVTAIEGYAGNFKARIKRKPRYVIEDLCVGCLLCVEKCIYKEPKFANEFDLGLSKRKPIYMPFPQAAPSVVLVDPKTCIQLTTGKCKQPCAAACERQAINFDQKEEIVEIEIGAIIIATGYQCFDARRAPQYGYGKYTNVYTSLEIERLVNAAGPTGGEIKLRNGEKPQTVGIIHCVGSRDKNFNAYCSRVCCMYSLKLAHLIKERTNAEVYNFYIDMRSAGKGYEEFYDKLLQEDVNFIRGRVAEVTDWAQVPEEEGKLVIRVEDTNIGIVRRISVDLVVLSVGLEPRADSEEVRKMFNIQNSQDGWYLERHPKLAPVSTFTEGIFLAGACQGPKDIPDSVAQAGAAASEALALIDRGYVDLEPFTAVIHEESCSGCRICTALCPYEAIGFNPEKNICEINQALCKGCGTCVAACPSGAARQNQFSDEQIYEEIEGVLSYV